MEQPRVRLVAAVVCDEVRLEANGKTFLIGVYSGGISVPDLPATIKVSAWLLAEAPEVGEIPFDVECRAPGGTLKGTGTLSVVESTEKNETAGFALKPFSLTIEREGYIDLAIRQYDDEWTIVKRIAVTTDLNRNQT